MIYKNTIMKYPLIISLIIFLGCSDKDKILLDQIEVTSLVNPEIGKIFQDGGIRLAYLTKNNEIIMITDNQLVYTNDLFQKLNFYSIGYINETLNPRETEHFFIFKHINNQVNIQIFDKQGSIKNINISKNNSWYSSNPSQNSGIIRHADFLNDKVGWILNNYDNGKLVLEKYKNNSTQVIHRFNFNDGKIIFYDNLFGYIFLPYWYFSSYWVAPGNVYMSTTSDGGLSWTEPRLIGIDIDIWDLQIFSKNSLVIKEEYDGNDYLFTKDGGMNWSKVFIPNGYKLEQIISCDLTLIKKDNYLFIFDSQNNISIPISSPISKNSWSAKGYFTSLDTGIIYNESEMYITFDGGQKWKMLAYPFGYLVTNYY